MRFANFFCSLNLRAPRSKRVCKPAAGRRYRPTLEVLEDRLAPAVLTVDTLLDVSGTNRLSLRDAIATVDAGNLSALSAGEGSQVAGTLGQNDTIVFVDQPGIMDLTAALPAIKRNLQILGPGPGQLIIHGVGTYQIFSVGPAATQVSFAGLALADGLATDTGVNGEYGGGAIYGAVSSYYTDSNNITVSDCAFYSNEATPVNPPNSLNGLGFGGAILCQGSLTVSNSTFIGNFAYQGGAIYSLGTTLLSNDSFTGNLAYLEGGAIENDTALSVQNSVFTGNTAGPTLSDGGGGGIGGAIVGATVTATNDTFTGNASNGTGTGSSLFGGGAMSAGAADIAGCTFDRNTSQTRGGALDLESPSSAVIVDSTFAGNSAQDGGGLWIGNDFNTGPVQLTNDTVSANRAIAVTALPQGGGIDVASGVAVTLDNTIVAGNTEISNAPDDIAGTVVATSAYNLIGDSASAGGLTATDGNHNLVGASPHLLPLANYGGPTETMLPAAGSPAIDAGSTAYVTNGETDQRGFSRVSGATVDIGAVERQPGGVGTYLELQGPATATAGVPMSWTAVALDDNGLPAATDFAPIVMSVASGLASFTASSTTQATAVYGTANFSNLTLDTPGYYSIQASFGNSSVTAPLVVYPFGPVVSKLSENGGPTGGGVIIAQRYLRSS